MKSRITIDDIRWTLHYWQTKFSIRQTVRSIHNSLKSWQHFWTSYHNYTDLLDTKTPPPLDSLYPCLKDDTPTTVIEPVYFYQDAWAFEHIAKAKPSYHVDVGSHHTFVALLSKVVPVTMVDIRPLSLSLDTLNFRQGNILDLPYGDCTVPSVSSLCVVEHIGLGRYGDQLDTQGTEKAITELKRIVAPGGHLYLSLPLYDMNLTYFNAHRAFSENYVRQKFEPFEVIDARYIYGNHFGKKIRKGFGIGCFQLRN